MTTPPFYNIPEITWKKKLIVKLHFLTFKYLKLEAYLHKQQPIFIICIVQGNLYNKNH